MLAELFRTKRNTPGRKQETRLRVEELSRRVMLSGDGMIEPPCPAPPAVDAAEIQIN
jgi:hypothetical protein